MEQTKKSRIVYRGPFFLLREDRVAIPGGGEKIRLILEHPGAAAAVPLLKDGRVILVRQYRKAIERETLEIPAGKLEKGETPLQCLRRELIEETGYRAGKLNKLISYYPSFGISDEIIHIYLARNLRRIGLPRGDESYLKTVFLPLEKVKGMIERGKIRDSKTIIGIQALENRGTTSNFSSL